MIRLANGSDAEQLLKIYGQYIDTPITFEYTLPTAAEFQDRINRTVSEYPYLVYEEDGAALGYAYAHRHMERAAYQWNAESAIYLDRGIRGKGVGTKLYSALIRLLRLQGFRTVYGCVTLPNPASESLHRKMGFQLVGTYHQAGYKCGKWYDVGWFELPIAEHLDGEGPMKPCSVWDLGSWGEWSLGEE